MGLWGEVRQGLRVSGGAAVAPGTGDQLLASEDAVVLATTSTTVVGVVTGCAVC